MYIGLTLKGSEIDINDNKKVVQFFKVNDTTFTKDFSAYYIDDYYGNIHLLNQMLEGIYDIYKYSKLSVCANFKLVIKNTFSQAGDQIKSTTFYKNNRKLVDMALERQINVIKY